MSALLNFVFSPPPSLFLMAMSAISIIHVSHNGLSEVMGKHMNYSKFWNVNVPTNKKGWMETTVPSKAGMLFAYVPAAVAAIASFFIPGIVVGTRAQLLSCALTLHFFKRVFEVLFIHQYSGQMLLGSAILITLSYPMITVSMIYSQYLSQDMAEPAIDLKYPGILLFLIGIVGNFYHHYLLLKLRQKGDKSYKIPSGGLFGLVICPHYLFEIITFIGVSFISQAIYPFSFAFGSTFYLIGRSIATKRLFHDEGADQVMESLQYGSMLPKNVSIPPSGPSKPPPTTNLNEGTTGFAGSLRYGGMLPKNVPIPPSGPSKPPPTTSLNEGTDSVAGSLRYGSMLPKNVPIPPSGPSNHPPTTSLNEGTTGVAGSLSYGSMLPKNVPIPPSGPSKPPPTLILDKGAPYVASHGLSLDTPPLSLDKGVAHVTSHGPSPDTPPLGLLE